MTLIYQSQPMKSITLLLTFLAVFRISANEARAALVFTATLSGSQELPAVVSPAVGSVRVSVFQSPGPPFTDYMDMQASVSGLSSGWSAAGLYGPASLGQTGPLWLDIAALFGLTPPPAATFGTFGLMDQELPIGMLDALNAGQIYFNLRSTAYPGGEVRGQLLPVPEPSAVLLALLGAILPGAFRRRPDPYGGMRRAAPPVANAA